MGELRWAAGSDPALIVRADHQAARVKNLRLTVTDDYDSATGRCRRCGSKPFRDVDEYKCLSSGHTLAYLGTRMTLAQAKAEVSSSRERYRLAALARWKEKPHKCLAGHLLDGDNVMIWAGRPRCKACYLARKSHCPNGHKYTAETTALSSHGRRRCLTCVSEGRYAKRQRAA